MTVQIRRNTQTKGAELRRAGAEAVIVADSAGRAGGVVLSTVRNPPNRHEIDVIARAVFSGRRGNGRRIDALADSTAALMRNRLAAVGAGGTGPRGAGAVIDDPQTLRALLARAEKHLAWRAVAEAGHARSRAR